MLLKIRGAARTTAIRAGLMMGVMTLAACGMVDGREDGGRPRPAPPPRGGGPLTGAVSDTPVKIGQPYQVGGSTYTPVDALNYDEVGYASWYGEELRGEATASGEAFNPDGVSGAHRTLPLPSYVEVTSLDTGRTILVRINDRGPFSNDRLLDLSSGAARQLGLSGNGVAAIRVRRVNPPEQEKAALRAGGAAAERLETPPSLLVVLRNRLGSQPRPSGPVVRATERPAGTSSGATPAGATPRTAYVPRAPAPTPPPARATDGDPFIVEQSGRPTPPRPSAPPPRAAPPPAPASSGGYVVQVAAFSSRARAEAAAKRIGARAVQGGGVWRVRFGPYPTEAAARDGVQRAAAKGFAGARIVAND